MKKSKSKDTASIDSTGFPAISLPIRPPYPPMEAKRVEAIPKGDQWQYEPKWDGFRAIVYRDKNVVAIQSKAGQPLHRYFPELVEEIRSLNTKQFVLDSEIVVPIGGILSFDDLLLRIHPAASRIEKLSKEIPASMIAFDLLCSPGPGESRSLITSPLRERRENLQNFFESIDPTSSIRLSPMTTDWSAANVWFEDFGRLGLDGVMAKLVDEPYHSGDREGMMKVKHLETADCVVGGYRYASNSQTMIGSLLLGLYDDENRLVFVGHTSSFNRNQKEELREVLEPLRGENPFEVRIPGGPSRWSTERSGEWVPMTPKLVCEVRYDYFSQARFRHGTTFLRWRPDKSPRSCTLDQVDPKSRAGSLKKLGMSF